MNYKNKQLSYVLVSIDQIVALFPHVAEVMLESINLHSIKTAVFTLSHFCTVLNASVSCTCTLSHFCTVLNASVRLYMYIISFLYCFERISELYMYIRFPKGSRWRIVSVLRGSSC